MSMKLFQLRTEREQALQKAEVLLTTAENQKRPLTATEDMQYKSVMETVARYNRDISKIESANTISAMINPETGMPRFGEAGASGQPFSKPIQKTFTNDYANEFFEYVKTNGSKVGAALYEGSNAAGGYAVPIVVDGLIVPLAPNEMAVRRYAQVIPTASDIKIPIKSAFGTTTAKTESGSSTHAFGDTSLTLTQKTLSAFMAGASTDLSFELAADVPAMQALVVDDLVLAQQMYEEGKYISGSGSGEPEGVLTGCATGVTITGAHLVQGAITLDSLYDLVASLNAVYHPGASWLMQRATALFIRKLQRQANLFEPVFTRVNGQDLLLGYPVEYSSYMPDGTTDQDKPVVFGDFKRGFIIGDRGGSGINIKVLDQPKATLGVIELLAYRRTDSRVRRSEALKALKLATGA